MNELIPAWANGTLTPVDKLEVHQRGLRHLAVSVFVMDGDKTLLQRRALGKYHTPGLWTNTCCTHPRWGEDPMDCANRRLREELGITGLALQSVGQIEYRADVGNGLTEHEVVEIFVAEASCELPLALNSAEVMQTKWVPRTQLVGQVSAHPALYTPWLKIYLDAGVAALSAG
ncbi:isopentenyl-diphosphate Delta-isomerase [Cypionkella sp.]|uniref:isopentenyl-diphosphate Delta-isomerase n=1 Tax=Cypionkella sp. TaxID=2811411 RepID=UPI002638DD7D|nr:isopentenyl-diphosphate Delta-isomerase [Cypionkella sp.]MDB5665676.1 isopentenyl-diphosphate delta-isomerase [Cypionkella sp.]